MYCYNCFNEIDAAPCPHCGYDNASNLDKYPTALEAGTVLGGQYILGRVLGQGGFGITYVAFDPKLRLKVAIKEYLPEALCTRTPGTTMAAAFSGEKLENFEYGKQSFLDEARTLAALGNVRGIAAVRTFFDENGTSYFVMDYVEGVSLKASLKNNGGKIPYEDAERILVPVIDTLATVHSNGVIHRDIAADNIYITHDGEVKLLDFGAAQYSLGEKSHSFDAVLKPGYTPKEQYMRRSRQGPFTDVYALGATFYASLTGYLPPESLERMESDEIVEPSVRGIKLPAHAEEAIMKALEVDAADRFQSMEEFKSALLGETVLIRPAPKAAPQAAAAPTSSVQPPGSAPKKNPPLVPILAGAGGLIVVGIVLLSVFLLNGKPNAERGGAEDGPIATPAADIGGGSIGGNSGGGTISANTPVPPAPSQTSPAKVIEAGEEPPFPYQFFNDMRDETGLYSVGSRGWIAANYGNEARYNIDLNGDNIIDELQIEISEIRNASGNNPTHISLRVGGSELSWDDDWNDGVVVEPIDFDADDGYVEIYSYSSGTDIDGYVQLIRYDGTRLYEYAGFGLTSRCILYDGDGLIYHADSYDGNSEYGMFLMEFDLAARTDVMLLDIADIVYDYGDYYYDPDYYYIIPYSDERLLTDSDLYGLTDWDLKLARNELYARHGRKFQAVEFQDYFNAQPWYVGLYEPEYFDANVRNFMSPIEIKNAEIIRNYEDTH
jgi:serine/threonine protein kinase